MREIRRRDHVGVRRKNSLGAAEPPVGAMLVAVPALLLGLDSFLVPLFLLTAMPVTVPIFLQRRPESFKRACVIVGLALAVWGCWASLWGCSCSCRRHCFCCWLRSQIHAGARFPRKCWVDLAAS